MTEWIYILKIQAQKPHPIKFFQFEKKVSFEADNCCVLDIQCPKQINPGREKWDDLGSNIL